MYRLLRCGGQVPSYGERDCRQKTSLLPVWRSRYKTVCCPVQAAHIAASPEGRKQMMEPKRISKASVPAALEKALRYRLLNEPQQAESICRDVLQVDSENQDAVILLLLALTDQFPVEKVAALETAKSMLPALNGDYQRAYYDGIIKERWAAAQLAEHMPQEIAFDWLRQAMRSYEKAERLSDPDNPESILRWNNCVRIIMRAEARKRDANVRRDVAAEYGDEVPMR
jgi:hypothetical protein